MTYAAAMVDAVVARMHDDPTMTLIGSAYLLGPVVEHPALNEVRERYADRIIDEPPISESAVAGLAIGSAMSGCRALAHFGRAAFAVEAWSQIIHEAGVAHHQSGGQIAVPAVFVMMHGIMPIEFSQHSRSPYAMLANCPGIQIVLASTPTDIKGLMTTALKSDNPTAVMNHPLLMAMEGEVPEGDFAIPFGEAEVKRAGRDVTLVATSHKVQVALRAAEGVAVDCVIATLLEPGAGSLPEANEPLASTEHSDGDGSLDVGGAAPGSSPQLRSQVSAATPAKSTLTLSSPQGRRARVPASPAARRLARERGIDISALKGTGPRGRIVTADVEAALTDSTRARGALKHSDKRSSTLAPSTVDVSPGVPVTVTSPAAGMDIPFEERPLSTLGKTMARRMAESKTAIPHFHCSIDVNVDATLSLRTKLNEAEDGPRLSLNDFVVHAVARALRETPRMNVQYSDCVMPECIDQIPVSRLNGEICDYTNGCPLSMLVCHVRCTRYLGDASGSGSRSLVLR